MDRDRRRAIKAVEKFTKGCRKEMRRLEDLREKAAGLVGRGTAAPLIGQVLERLQQKELMASGDIVWAEQMIEQLRAAPQAAETASDAAPAKKSAPRLI